jgi:hypothetical protein
MLKFIGRMSDKLASSVVSHVDAGACLPRDTCYCAPQACPKGQTCRGALFKTNCTGQCTYAGVC